MKTTHRPYRDDAGDFALLARFVSAIHGAGPSASAWRLPRFVDWRYNQRNRHLDMPDFLAATAELWFDGFGDMIGLALSESAGSDFIVQTLPGWRHLFGEMTAWAEAAWAKKGEALRMELTEDQGREMAILEDRGYAMVNDCQENVFDLAAWIPARTELEEGFSIVDMGPGADARAQDRLRMDAFHGPDSVSEERLDERAPFTRAIREAPYYHPWTDICVRAPDGRYVAGCEALHDPRNSYAELERVCTHSAYRRRGFARAAILECLNRLKEMGTRTATLMGFEDGPKLLYSSLGHHSSFHIKVFEKKRS